MRRQLPGFPFVDTLLATLVATVMLLALALVAARTQTPVPPALRTPGIYAVVATWPGGFDEDVDLYLRDPQGNIVYFSNKQAGLVHLERDDRGFFDDRAASGRVVHPRLRVERIVIQGVEPGQFIANVHLYRQGTRRPVPVSVSLWKLAGADHPVATVHVTLRHEAQELTAFRFTLTAAATITGVNRLPFPMVGAAVTNVPVGQ